MNNSKYKIASSSIQLIRNSNICSLLGQRISLSVNLFNKKKNCFIGWGRKSSGKKAVALAVRYKKQFILVEDGFLRSFLRTDQALSFVFDHIGIYYDANSPSQLEYCIAQRLTKLQIIRTKKIINNWKQLRLSKYNGLTEYKKSLPDQYVLVIDQVEGDLSIQYGWANKQSFARMLQAALDEHTECTVLVKVHPDLIYSSKMGHFDSVVLENHPRVIMILDYCHCVRLIEKAKQVYVVTSQIGFEALVWGKKVRCFGMPFYAGWGLTNDELIAPDRREKVNLEQLVHAALVDYPCYYNPVTQGMCQVDEVMCHLGLRTQFHRSFPETLYALGFSRLKQRHLKGFLSEKNIIFKKKIKTIPSSATVLTWGHHESSYLSQKQHVIRIEDGFLRSVGLGADLIQPLSWVFDDLGIYYDSSKPSKIENILQNTVFDETLLSRAKALRSQCLSNQITKYNLLGHAWQRPITNKIILLVVGQVETDASIRYGSPHVQSNLQLLKIVQLDNPHAYILYKPHPDVEAGLRKRGKGESDVINFCNEIVYSVSVEKLLTQIDELHTMTSLMGFEALLRGIKVVCYGQPFYSSWGLTIDRYPVTRRTKQLTLDELVAGVLILYPTYLSRKTKLLATPEVVVQELSTWKAQGGLTMSLWRRMLRTVLQVWSRFPKKQQV